MNIDRAFERFDETWAPRVITRVNDYDVRIARVDGDHARHVHLDTDEFFLCLEGSFTIEMDGSSVVLGPGDTFTVPRGVHHFPRAESGTRILMFEPRGTPTTGDDHGADDPAIAHLRTTRGLALDP